MAENAPTGNLSFVSGSTAEGQTYARHLANQNIQDIDVLIHAGQVKSSENIIQTGVPGFVRIRFDDQIQPTGSTEFFTQTDINGIVCVNGYRLKEEHCGGETTIGAPLSYVKRSGQTSADSSGAAAAQSITYQSIDLSQQLYDALQTIENQSINQFNPDLIADSYHRFCVGVEQAITNYALPLMQTVATQMMVEGQIFKDLFTLAGPAYGYRLPQVTFVRLRAVLDFYDKYTHVGNPNEIKNIVEYFQSCAPVDVDLVPSLQLKFWPDDVQPFLKRIAKHRPEISELILKTSSMHVIAKWSGKTPAQDQDLEFRYSFSAIELILAQHRSVEEQILNGIARSIYYKYLKGQRTETQNVIPSYFIKTTVLWMCETMNLKGDQPEDLARKWLEYAMKKLEEHQCSHYIIPDINILEPFQPDAMAKAREILSRVNINDIHRIEMFSASKQEFYRNQYQRDFAYYFSQLKISDICNVLRDYREFKRTWIIGDSNIVIPQDDELDLSEALSIFNTLRSLDGDRRNLQTFRRLFLTEKPSRPPIWGETISNETAASFVECLVSIGVILTHMNKHVCTDTELKSQRPSHLVEDLQNYQNVLGQYLNPRTLFSSLQSTYSYWYNQSVDAFERRGVIDHHPHGPKLNFDQSVPDDREFSRFILQLCQTTTNQDLTIRQAYQEQSLEQMTEDEQLALAIQNSLDDISLSSTHQ